MGKRPGPVEIIWRTGEVEFAFLVQQWGFDGPEHAEDGIAYHHPDMHIELAIWAWKNEAGLTTGIRRRNRATGAMEEAGLECLYLAAGLGPAQDVPENVGGGRSIAKRVAQQARAVQRLLPLLNRPGGEELMSRCRPGPH